MAVDAKRDGGRGTAEALLNDSRVDSLFERKCCPCVANSVLRQPSRAVLADAPHELSAHGVGTKAGAVGLVVRKTLV